MIYALCKYELLVIYPVNPQTVAKYRQAFAPSRAKADRSDAQILMELLFKHPDKLKAWKPSSSTLRSHREFSKTAQEIAVSGGIVSCCEPLLHQHWTLVLSDGCEDR